MGKSAMMKETKEVLVEKLMKLNGYNVAQVAYNVAQVATIKDLDGKIRRYEQIIDAIKTTNFELALTI